MMLPVRKKLRALMAGKRLALMPGAYDALSARIIESEGFEAIVAGGYAAVGSMLAQPDMGQSNVRDYASHYARICEAVTIPVYVDADTGFGGVNNVRQMVRAFEAGGAAGLFISDQVFPNRCGYLPGKQIVPVEQMLAKIKAALDARVDPDFFIAARTDAAGVESVEAAIERCQLFMAAGADMAKPMGIDGIAEIKRALREVPGPHRRRCRRPRDRRRAASMSLKRQASRRRPSRHSRCSRRRMQCGTYSACSSAKTRLRPASRT
jgi:methylisocitrate lyase